MTRTQFKRPLAPLGRIRIRIPPRPRYSGHDLVYFLHAPQIQAVKIGVSRDPDERIKTIQTGFPLDLILLHWVRGTFSHERRLQRHFVDLRIKGEWFRDTAELLGYVEWLKGRPNSHRPIAAGEIMYPRCTRAPFNPPEKP